MSTGTIGTWVPEPSALHELPGRRERRWWWLVGVLGLAAFVILTLALTGDDGGSGTDAVTPPAPTPQPTAADAERALAVWPVGWGTRYDDAVEASRAFAVDYLGMSAPVVGELRRGDARSSEVEIRPTAIGPVTTVLLRQLAGETSWSVLGAMTQDIDVTEPVAGALVQPDFTAVGVALAREGDVIVQVREDGSTYPLGAGAVPAGRDRPREFSVQVPFAPPSQPYGALVFLARGTDRSVQQATVMRVQLGTPGPGQS